MWKLDAMTNRPIVLIADDYALTPCISDSILMLIDAGRLSGTSAMVTGRHWFSYAKDLAARRDRADAGLHIDLTTGAPLTMMPVLAPQGVFHVGFGIENIILFDGARRSAGRNCPANRDVPERFRPIAGLFGRSPACACSARDSRCFFCGDQTS